MKRSKCDNCEFDFQPKESDIFFRDEECLDGSYVESEMSQCPKCGLVCYVDNV